MQRIINDEQQSTSVERIVTDPVCGMKKPIHEMKVLSVFLETHFKTSSPVLASDQNDQ